MVRYEKGNVYMAEVTCIESYGAFVKLEENYTGLIHISEISHKFVKNVSNFLKVGEHIYVEVVDIDDDLKHLKLSIKNINYRYSNSGQKKGAIEETPHGFTTLKAHLPIWINKKLKNIQNEKIMLDK